MVKLSNWELWGNEPGLLKEQLCAPTSRLQSERYDQDAQIYLKLKCAGRDNVLTHKRGAILMVIAQQAYLFNETAFWTGKCYNTIENKLVLKFNVMYLNPMNLWEIPQRTFLQNLRTKDWKDKNSLAKSDTQKCDVLYTKTSVWNR